MMTGNLQQIEGTVSPQNERAGREQGMYRDIHLLSLWLRQIENDYTALMQSFRWKTGNALVRLAEIMLLRTKQPLATDHLERVFREHRSWRSQPGQEKQDLAQLSMWMRQVRKDVDDLLMSRRWRSGHAVASFLEHVLLRRKPQLAVDHMKRVIGEYGRLADAARLRILFVLPQPLDSNCGYHAERLAEGLCALGAECMAAVPEAKDSPHAPCPGVLPAAAYREILENGCCFSGGRPPDLIHAWTPRESVRKFVTALAANYPCPVVVHLEDNEEYLTETAAGRPFTELEKMPETELDRIIPGNRYHPVYGRRWLSQVQGLTLIIDTLEKFNVGRVPSLTLLPPVDDRLFYPRPVNRPFRQKLKIPENHLVLVYAGNVHAANREEVLTLYRAVQLLNRQGRPATLIRTGKNAVPLIDGDASWISEFEIFLGWVPREELPDIMACADLFVQPGRPGPFNDYRIPCKLPEYFAMGRPVILPAANLGLSLPDGAGAYVMDRSGPEGIVDAVLQVLADHRAAEKRKNPPPGPEKTGHPLVGTGEKLERFYRDILNRNTGRTGPSPFHKKSGRIAFVDHFYHRKTRSSWFFLRYLARFFDVDVYWDYSYRGEKQPDGAFIRDREYDFIVFWQCVHAFETINALSSRRRIGVPMYDNSGEKPIHLFHKEMEYLSFSSHMHHRLVQCGCRSTCVQFFPDPVQFPRCNPDFSELKGFFWQRTPAITWDTIRKLLDETPFARFHVHWDLDGEHLQVPEFPPEWKGIPVTQSRWFQNRSDYHDALRSSNVFFAPRPKEGIGFTFLEAMAMGMCVVAPDRPTMNEYIGHQINGLLYDPASPAPLDFSGAKLLGRNARKSIETGRQCWQNQMKKVLVDLFGVGTYDADDREWTAGEKMDDTLDLPGNVREILPGESNEPDRIKRETVRGGI